MSSNEYVKYLTQRIVKYMDTPKIERKATKPHKEHWVNRWFGMIPMSLKMMFGKDR
jgi:hypothetical protein